MVAVADVQAAALVLLLHASVAVHCRSGLRGRAQLATGE